MKENTERGGKKKRNYGSMNGGGMKKHARSGVAHNHSNSISRVREYNREQEVLQEIKKRQKPKMFSTVADVFNYL